MIRNVGGIDRILRVTLGAILLLGGLILLSGRISVGVVLAVVGLLALITGIVRFCVLYIPFGISTAGPKERPMTYMCDCVGATKEAQCHPTVGEPPPVADKQADEVAMSAAKSR
jgi:Inner membrane protein YgaP-like, transmembrane domain